VSKTKLKMNDRWALFYKAGGRCSLCCESLDYDIFSRSNIHVKEYAHIIADSEAGARGGSLSKQSAGDIENFIVLCPKCHTVVDNEKPLAYYTVDRLRKIKADHEQRVQDQLSALKNKVALVVKYTAKIGENHPTILMDQLNEAVRKSKFIAQRHPIDLNPNFTAFSDNQDKFWDSEWSQLQENFKLRITEEKAQHSGYMFLLFAIAPIPLLIRLGILFGDISNVKVFQKRREPDTWTWLDKGSRINYTITRPSVKFPQVAVKLSLSDNITDDRIQKVLGMNTSIWNITHQNPHNDFIKSRRDLEALRKNYRTLFKQIREVHGQDTVVHVFPACPVSAAVEFGRAYMPKSDAKLILYDQNNNNGGFSLAYNLSK
jgi:hypothetical protein